jgi:mono/diheme cytochrome c family protein
MKFSKWLPLCALMSFAVGSVLFAAQAQSQQQRKGTVNAPVPTAGQGETPQRPAANAPSRPRRNAGDFLAIGAPPDPAAVERGQKIFVSTCAFCHGANANGGESGPDLVRSVVVLHDNNGDSIGPVVLHGRPGKGMPAFPSMTKAQISDIAAFLKSRYQAAANRMNYKILNIVTGNAEAGKAYFNGPGKCNTCHSPTGDLAGIAKKYEPVALQAKFLYPRERSRDPLAVDHESAPTKVTVTLPSGGTESGVLVHIDDFNVSFVDSSENYHSYPLRGPEAVKAKVDDPLAAHAELLTKYSNADMHNVLAYLETLK